MVGVKNVRACVCVCGLRIHHDVNKSKWVGLLASHFPCWHYFTQMSQYNQNVCVCARLCRFDDTFAHLRNITLNQCHAMEINLQENAIFDERAREREKKYRWEFSKSMLHQWRLLTHKHTYLYIEARDCSPVLYVSPFNRCWACCVFLNIFSHSLATAAAAVVIPSFVFTPFFPYRPFSFLYLFICSVFGLVMRFNFVISLFLCALAFSVVVVAPLRTWSFTR